MVWCLKQSLVARFYRLSANIKLCVHVRCNLYDEVHDSIKDIQGVNTDYSLCVPESLTLFLTPSVGAEFRPVVNPRSQALNVTFSSVVHVRKLVILCISERKNEC